METWNKNSLAKELKKPLDKSLLGQDVAAVNALVNMLNDPDRQPAEAEIQLGPPPPPSSLAGPSSEPKAGAPPVFAEGSARVSNPPPELIFFTGKIRVGKDWLANEIGAKIFGLADPIYYLASHLCSVSLDSNTNKDLPGMRVFLQTIGQWGRGTLDATYPFTPARACFVTMIKSLAAAGVIKGHGVDWVRYGEHSDIWLDACISRVDEHRIANPASTIAITNVRFENEFKTLRESGWTHYHVVASNKTYQQRLVSGNLSLESPQLKDMSEQLANGLDNNVLKQISTQRNGPKLRCIWNDPKVPPVSSRLYTIQQFKDLFNLTSEPKQLIVTGE